MSHCASRHHNTRSKQSVTTFLFVTESLYLYTLQMLFSSQGVVEISKFKGTDSNTVYLICSHSLLPHPQTRHRQWHSLPYLFSLSSTSPLHQAINGTLSEEKCFNISVIQGSILGTILFLCYLYKWFLHLYLPLYNTFCWWWIFLAKNKNLNELIIYVNLELQKIANWFLSNKMAINTSKTKFILFRTQGKKVDDQICKIVFNNNEIGKFQDPQTRHRQWHSLPWLDFEPLVTDLGPTVNVVNFNFGI